MYQVQLSKENYYFWNIEFNDSFIKKQQLAACSHIYIMLTFTTLEDQEIAKTLWYLLSNCNHDHRYIFFW